jgi:hypothetical protein
MDFGALVRANYQLGHNLLESVIADCGEALHATPSGSTNTIAATYAHIVIGEDFFAAAVDGKPMLLDASRAAKTGVPAVTIPRITPELAAIRMNLEPFQEYAKAVYARTEALVAGLSDADWQREVETPFGKSTVANLLGSIGFYHVAEHSGEIAALKGVQGLKGLPF